MYGFEKRVALGDNDYLDPGESRVVPLVACHGRLEVDDRLSKGRLKTAAAEEAVAEAQKLSPVPGRAYNLVIGLGSEEFWGTNNNGDSFPEHGLLGLPPKDVSMSFFDRYAKRLPKEWGFKTFKKAHVFEEHRNTNPRLAIGGVHDTFWNNRMHRVENLIWLDRGNVKAAKWVKRSDENEPFGTSMACRVPFDRCSICGNLAPTKAQYCGHLRSGSSTYQLRQIRPDGKAVSMINDFPDFFDESCVETPAAPEALNIMKVASEQKEAGAKQAVIKKEAPDLPLDVALDELGGLYQAESSLPPVVLNKLAGFDMPSIIAGFEKLGMALHPSELMHVVFGAQALGHEEGKKADKKALKMPPKAASDIEPIVRRARVSLVGSPDYIKVARVVDLIKPYAPTRSYAEPYLTPRLIRAKAASVDVEPLTPTEEGVLEVYHTVYKAASGMFGIGPRQAQLAWEGITGER